MYNIYIAVCIAHKHTVHVHAYQTCGLIYLALLFYLHVRAEVTRGTKRFIYYFEKGQKKN